MTAQEIAAMKAENEMLKATIRKTSDKLNNIVASNNFDQGNILSSASYLKVLALKIHLKELVSRIS